MRRKSKYVVLSLVLCLSMMLFLCGCGEEKSGSTIEEPEITGKYLQEDYSQQLLNDGAEGRIACQKGKELNVVSADDFIQDHNDGESQLYTVYLMGDSAELILATDPADVETK